MENLEYILSLAGTTLSLLAACITFAIKVVKAVKAKKETIMREKIVLALPELIEKAEQYLHYSGEEKKEFVLTKVKQFAIDNDLDFDLSFISGKIEELIMLSKNVNNKNTASE